MAKQYTYTFRYIQTQNSLFSFNEIFVTKITNDNILSDREVYMINNCG